MRSLNLQVAKRWDDIPDPWKSVRRLPKIPVKQELKDKGLLKVFEPFMGKDDLRPALTALNVDDQFISATNAHVLLTVPSNGNIPKGTWIISNKKSSEKLYTDISDKHRFPDYKSVITNKNPYVFKVNLIKLKTYLQSVILGQYCNPITKLVSLFVNQSKDNLFLFSVNAEFLIDAINSIILLGDSDYGYFGFIGDKKALYISTSEQGAKYPNKSMSEYPIALIMPLMLDRGYDIASLGAKDVDYATAMEVYFSFETGEIHNADKSVARFDENLNNDSVPYLAPNYIELLTKAVPKKPLLPILENVLILDRTVCVSDLQTFITLPGIDIENGIYQIVNKAFKGKLPYYKEEEFIKLPDPSKYKKVGTIDSKELSYHLKQSAPFVSHDELQPKLTGLHLIKESTTGKLKIYASNAHILYRVDIENNSLEKLSIIVPNPKLTSLAIENMVEQNTIISIKGNNENVMFSGGLMYDAKLVDAKSPDFESVYNNQRNKILYMDGQKLLAIINSIKKEKDRNALIFKPIGGIKSSGKFQLFIAGKYLHDDNDYESPININQEIEYRIENKETNSHENVGIIMGMIAEANSRFVFDYNYLKTIIPITEPELGLMFNDGNEFLAYHFNIRTYSGSSDKKVNLPVEKPDNKEKTEKLIKTLNLSVKYTDGEEKASIEKQIKALTLSLKYR